MVRASRVSRWSGRLGEDADYQSLSQFLADSPWDPALVVGDLAERVVCEIDIHAWVLDETGFPKDGTRSPGVTRQYSQAPWARSVTVRSGCRCTRLARRGRCRSAGRSISLSSGVPERRRTAKIPPQVAFQTKPELGAQEI